MPRWEVHLFENIAADRVDVYIWHETFEESRRVLQATGEVITVPHGQEVPPTMKLPAGVTHGFAEALDRLGVKTDKDATLQGTMEAMRAHLADLRQLLKLK